MSIYLAWSVYKLVGTLVVWLLVSVMLLWLSKRLELSKKIPIAMSAFYLVILLFGAINVGDRQVELDRGRFDATMPAQVEQQKIESQRRTIESVNEAFEKAVKKTE